MVQRRLRAETGVELRPSAGREPPQNLRVAAGDRLVTSHRLKPRPAGHTPRAPAESVVRKARKERQKKVVWTREKDLEKHSVIKTHGREAVMVLGDGLRFDVKLRVKALTFLACIGSLGGLVGPTGGVTRGLAKIRQDAVHSHHLGFNRRTDGG